MRRTALLALLLSAACGTTVPLTQQSQSLSGDGLSGGTGGTSDLTTSTSSGTTGGTGRSSLGGTTGGVSLPGSSTGSSSTGTTGTTGAASTGGTVTQGPATSTDHSPVQVGLLVVKDLGPATAALGVKGLSTGDGEAQAKASVAILNARGGLAGHPVKPVIFVQDPTQDATTQYQAACSLFFDDNKAKAVISWALGGQMQSCAEKHGVPFVTAGNRSTSAAEIAKHATSAVASQWSLDRMVPQWVASLKAQKWFAPASPTEQIKVGLLYNEDPDFAVAPSLVSRALSSVGLTLTAQQSMPGTDDTSKVASASSAGSNAALKFASLNVNRVLTIDKSGQAMAYFGLAAANQGYYPLYGLTSLELPSALRTVLSARQLQGSRGIGWTPSTDVPSTAEGAASSNRKACLKAMADIHQDMATNATRFSALATCDAVLLLGAAWKDPALTTSTFLSGLRALGTSYPSVTSMGDDFSSHRDGAAAYRALAYQSGCDCFAYSGPLQRTT